jgi:hypothetical protein
MPATHVVNLDLAHLCTTDAAGRKNLRRVLAWGDPVEVVSVTSTIGALVLRAAGIWERRREWSASRSSVT